MDHDSLLRPLFVEPDSPAWQDRLTGPTSAPLRTPVTTALLEQALLDEGWHVARACDEGRLCTWWLPVPDGATRITDALRGRLDDGWRIDWSVRSDILRCRSTADSGGPGTRSILRRHAAVANGDPEGLHAVVLEIDPNRVVTRGAVPLPTGVTVADLRAITHLLSGSLVAFHLGVLDEVHADR